MRPASAISGQVVDALGKPVGDTVFSLEGVADKKILDESIFDTVLASIQAGVYRFSGWGKQPGWIRSSIAFSTDANGNFAVHAVPGRHFLYLQGQGKSGYSEIPMPSAYYPGVFSREHATPLVVEEGKVLSHIRYRLPDFGAKRRVEIVVMNDSGRPVAGAYVRDGGTIGLGRMTSSGEQRMTDATGRVVYQLWSKCDYSFHAEFYPPQRKDRWESFNSNVDVPAGAGPITRTVVLRGLK
jgi:hypothetical protein